MEEVNESFGNPSLSGVSGSILEIDRKIEEKFNLTGELGINDERERFFFYRYFDLRARRAGGIGSSRLLSHPMIQQLRDVPIIGGIIHSVQAKEAKEDAALAEIKELLAKTIAREYTTSEARQRIKTIEMAANDLASKGVVQGETQSQGSTVMVDIGDVVQQWSHFWKNKLVQTE